MGDVRRATITVVDDDPDVRSAMDALLTAAGYRCRRFESAESFLSARGHERCTCLILDIELYGMSGLALQRELRDYGLNIPIIFLSARPDPSFRRRAFADGAVDFFCKPGNPERLLQRIEQTLAQQPARFP